ncbi:MAG: putative signal peptide-containing protein [Actinomycetia bacterium]|nr:putative signal peptide-containing protein [Actinomycetes bacterium]
MISSRTCTAIVAIGAGAVVALGGCSRGDTVEASRSLSASSSARSKAATAARPPGPAADLSQELSGGNGVFLPGGSATTASSMSSPPPKGYVAHEYVASGTATSYRAEGELTRDGRWTFVPADSAPYRTRILVRRPADPKRFSGNVIVEWLNVSGGVDSGPDYDTTHEEITRAGDAWVGVSAQLIGVMGGPVLVKAPTSGPDLVGKGLRAIDPARYGTLQHPGDGYSYDIFTQVARAIRLGGTPLGGLHPKRLIGAGESQSAIALVTYINGVAPLAQAFDGYLIHSRGASGLPLAAPGQAAGIADSLSGRPTIFRTDLDAPILDLQTESDTGLLGSLAARQPDDAHFRLWEVAGTAHADARLLGAVATQLDCGLPVNNGPMHVVVKAGLHALDTWLRTGTPPPKAPRFETTSGAKPELRRDADGIVLGGIRTPPVDVPVVVLSGVVQPGASTICLLSGSTKPLTAARIAQLYPSQAAYTKRYRASMARAIKAGHVLAADRRAMLAYAQPQLVQP